MKKVFVFGVTLILSIIYLYNAFGQNLPSGLPEDIRGYKKWTRLNRKIIPPKQADPHHGFKREFVNRRKEELVDSMGNLIFPYPDGTIVVKDIRATRKKNGRLVLVSVMRKLPGNETTGGWDFIEYTGSSSDNSFVPIQFPKESCYACHRGASNSDSVWTKFDNF